jgi:hypothetical protein
MTGSGCSGVTYSLTLYSRPSGMTSTDALSYFTLSQPPGIVRVTANPTLATKLGYYHLHVTAEFNDNLGWDWRSYVYFEVIGTTLTLSPSTNSVIIGNSTATVKNFGPTDTIQTPASGFTI